MADFCAPCVAELFSVMDRRLNDFAYVAGPTDPAWSWILCEGCGRHLFDSNGERRCGNRPSRQAIADCDGERTICQVCRDLQASEIPTTVSS